MDHLKIALIEQIVKWTDNDAEKLKFLLNNTIKNYDSTDKVMMRTYSPKAKALSELIIKAQSIYGICN